MDGTRIGVVAHVLEGAVERSREALMSVAVHGGVAAE
jgi:hypothetical protein